MADVDPIRITQLGTSIRRQPGAPNSEPPTVQIGRVTAAPSVIGSKNYVTVDGNLMKYVTGLSLAVNDVVVYARGIGQYPVVLGELVI